ncbi:hypothetical protein TYRP_007549 [Tyrophagus putrescentiae]|nr:hypothetical protein TYRP_007549 [Tyrophagus putrescentiae]
MPVLGLAVVGVVAVVDVRNHILALHLDLPHLQGPTRLDAAHVVRRRMGMHLDLAAQPGLRRHVAPPVGHPTHRHPIRVGQHLKVSGVDAVGYPADDADVLSTGKLAREGVDVMGVGRSADVQLLAVGLVTTEQLVRNLAGIRLTGVHPDQVAAGWVHQ